MKYIKRVLNLDKLLKNRSVMLLGPRQTGKSMYINKQLQEPVLAYFNLLDQATLLNLSTDLTRMRQEIESKLPTKGIVVIDEVQKIPQLLDEVHLMIEKHSLRFLLTGSSASKLRRSGVNLLGGRARSRNFHPLTALELGEKFILIKAMNHGLIPFHYFSDLPNEDLRAYIGQYLAEEIAAEALVRNIPAFARFLEVAASCNTQQINFSAVASDAQVNRQTVQNYFQLLNDTLVGSFLPPYSKGAKRKTVSAPKFYFFDMGVVKSLRRLSNIEVSSKDFGDFFEHFIYLELCAWRDYNNPDAHLSYWRTKNQHEVDFIIDDSVAIEVKSSSHITPKHLKSLKVFSEEQPNSKAIVVCQEKEERLLDGISILPWQLFLEKLWKNQGKF